MSWSSKARSRSMKRKTKASSSACLKWKSAALSPLRNSSLAMTQIDYQAPVKVPLGQRINLRIILFAAVVLIIIGYPAYLIIEMQVTGGVRQIAGGYKEVDLKAMSSFQ